MENKSTYMKLSEEARRKNSARATAYNREKAAKITIKTPKANFTDIEQYMDNAISKGLKKSKNDFLLSAIRYAINNDFLDCEIDENQNNNITEERQQ